MADFAGYLERAGMDTVTVEAAVAWAVGPMTSPLRHFQRLAMVRGFATPALSIASVPLVIEAWISV